VIANWTGWSFLGNVVSGGAGAAFLIRSENLCIELRNLYFFENKQVVMGEGEGKVKIYIDSSNRQVAAPPRWATLESKKRWGNVTEAIDWTKSECSSIKSKIRNTETHIEQFKGMSLRSSLKAERLWGIGDEGGIVVLWDSSSLGRCGERSRNLIFEWIGFRPIVEMINVKSGMFEAADELSGVSGEVTESLTDPVEWSWWCQRDCWAWGSGNWRRGWSWHQRINGGKRISWRVHETGTGTGTGRVGVSMVLWWSCPGTLLRSLWRRWGEIDVCQIVFVWMWDGGIE
jgi:hypothetical protein